MVEAFQKNLMDHNGPLATISPGFLVHIPTTWTGPDWAGVVALCYEMMLWSQLCQVNLAAHLLLLLSSLFKWKVKCAGHIIVYSAEAELASCFVDSETYTVLWKIWNLNFLGLLSKSDSHWHTMWTSKSAWLSGLHLSLPSGSPGFESDCATKILDQIFGTIPFATADFEAQS